MGLGINIVIFFFYQKKILILFSTLKFVVIEPLDPFPDPHSPKSLIRIRIETYADPQH